MLGDSKVNPNTNIKTILLIDDEESVLEIGQLMLEHAGYKVITASDGKTALAQFSGDLYIDAVILDLSLPVMSGKEILEGILARNPEQKVIISSGYDLGGTAEELLLKGADDFLQKPYQMETMLKMVEDVLIKEKSMDLESRRKRLEEIVTRVRQ